MKKLNGDRIFIIFNCILAGVFMLIALYPLWYSIIASFSSTNAIVNGKVWIIPRDITFIGYETMFAESDIWSGYLNSVIYTVTGTMINLLCTVPAAYALSRPSLPFRRAINFYFLLTMFIGGGLVPTYLLVDSIGLNNTPVILVILGAVSVYNMIVCRTFFQTSIPSELIDAAKIDGGSDLGIFARVVIPLSKPILAVMVLYFAVGHWNSYYNAMIYLRDKARFPLQLVLRTLLLSTKMMSEEGREYLTEKMMAFQTMKFGVVIAASFPVMVMYPFVQKYFVKGVMIGAVKG